jgi:hypothetical protein
MSFIKIQRIDPTTISNPDPGHIYVGQDLSVTGFGNGTSGFWQKDEWGQIFYINSGTGGGTGTSGSSGVDGTFYGSSGSSGNGGTNGTSGISGRSGSFGTSGSSGSSGLTGTSGTSSTAGTSSTSGKTGTSGSSGVDGTFYGSSGTSGYDGGYGGATRVWKFSYNTPNPAGGRFIAGNDYYPLNYSLSLVNKIIINTTDLDNQQVDNWLNSWITGTLKIEDKLNASVFGIYSLSSVSNSKPSITLNLISGFTMLSSSIDDLIDDRDYFISFVAGGSGSSGVDGSFLGTHGTAGTSGKDGSFLGTHGTAGTSGIKGTSGTSGKDGFGTSGTSGNGTSGISGSSGTSGDGSSGINGSSGTSGERGTSGTSGGGTSGTSGTNGTSGTSGVGTNGTSGTSGVGTNGTSGRSSTSGTSGTSVIGSSGTSGGGTSGTSGTSGVGSPGSSGTSGVGSPGSSGTSGIGSSGTSGNGLSGSSGTAGTSSTSGTSGTSGISGTSGKDGTGGTSGKDGTSGSSGKDGLSTSGTSGKDGLSTSGTSGNGLSGTNGTSGVNGTSGISGTSGKDGTGGTSSTAGTSGINGTSGLTGTSGINGTSGTSSTSGSTGTSGSSGTSSTSGTSGSSGTSSTSGTSGSSGTSSTSGTSATTGTSGTNGLLPILGTSGELVYTDPTALYGYNVNTGLTFSGNTLKLTGITLKYSTGLEGTGKVLTCMDNFGTVNWVGVESGITEVMDRTFDLKIVNEVLSVTPYGTKKLIDPGYAYFYLTGNTSGDTSLPSYYNPLTLDGVLNSTGQNVYTIENTSVLGPELNVNPDGWTVTGDAVSVGSGKYTFNSSGVAGSISYNFGTFSLTDVYVFIFYFSNSIGGGFPGITFAGVTKTYMGGSYSGSQFNHYEINPINTLGICTLTIDSGAYTNYYIDRISIKKVLSPSNKYFTHYTTGTTSNEFRSSYSNENISVGLDSGRYLVPTNSNISTGTGNLSFGKQSIYRATVATNNIGIGNYTHWDLREGEDNIAIGNYALYLNRLGIRNIAIGTQTLAANTSNYNIAIGHRVMAVSTSASSNVGIGSGVMGSLSTGVSNTAIGINSSLALTSGNHNTSLGYSSLQNINTGSNNVGIGIYTFGNLSTGSLNVGLGYYSGFGVTTGSNNTHLGPYTGGGVTDYSKEVSQYAYNSADSSNVFIGYLASKSTYTVAATSNSVAIGMDAKIYQSDQVTLGGNNVSSTFLKGSVELRDFTILANETLSDINPIDNSKWTTTGDMSVLPGSGLTYTYNTGSGTFSQTFGNQLNPLKGNRWYKVILTTAGGLAIPGPQYSSYTISITGNTFAPTTLNFYTFTNTSEFLYLKTIANPTNITFNITCNLGTGNGIVRISNISIKECIGGDLFVNRKITGYGPNVRFQLDPTVTGNTSTAYFFDTETPLTSTGSTLLSIRNSGSTKFDVDSVGNLQVLRGNAIYHRQIMGIDTIGDWRQWGDNSGFYTDFCTGVNPTVWTTKQTISSA